MSDEGIKRLAVAMVQLAVDDWRKLISQNLDRFTNKNCRDVSVKSIRRFMLGPWGFTYCDILGLNNDVVMEKLEKELSEAKNRS